MPKDKFVTKSIHGKNPNKPKLVPFLDLVTGHKFEFANQGTMPEGTHFWCAFCGGRGKHYVEIRRDGKEKYKVGKRCAERVHIIVNPSVVQASIPDAVPVIATNGNNDPTHPEKDELDDDIEKLLKEL